MGGKGLLPASQPRWAPSEIYESLRRAKFRRDETEVFSRFFSSLYLSLAQKGPGNDGGRREIADP